jgi:hypothetical protein
LYSLTPRPESYRSLGEKGHRIGGFTWLEQADELDPEPDLEPDLVALYHGRRGGDPEPQL